MRRKPPIGRKKRGDCSPSKAPPSQRRAALHGRDRVATLPGPAPGVGSAGRTGESCDHWSQRQTRLVWCDQSPHRPSAGLAPSHHAARALPSLPPSGASGLSGATDWAAVGRGTEPPRCQESGTGGPPGHRAALAAEAMRGVECDGSVMARVEEPHLRELSVSHYRCPRRCC